MSVAIENGISKVRKLGSEMTTCFQEDKESGEVFTSVVLLIDGKAIETPNLSGKELEFLITMLQQAFDQQQMIKDRRPLRVPGSLRGGLAR